MYVTPEPIRLEEFFAGGNPLCGAASVFVGKVRNHHAGRGVKALFYEGYGLMAEKMIGEIVETTLRRWPVEEILVKHRVGRLEIGDTAVAIAVGAAHRDEAFTACRFVIEEIKARVPIWKKEFYEDGTAAWTRCAHAKAVS